ncbi:hypothetical protein [Gemmata sp.]|uniref:hypothetical protein n=1 Tax=Gemmata sp. TaxID=1914242 RepID=UPI003F70D23D
MAGELTAGAGGTGDGPVSVALTADVSQFERQLDKAGAAFGEMTKHMEDRIRSAADKVKKSSEKSGESLKRIGEAVAGGFGGGLAAGGVMGALTAIGDVGGKAIKELAVGLRMVNTEGLAMSRWSADVADKFARMNKNRDDSLAALVDPAGQKAELEKQIAELEAKRMALTTTSDEVVQKLDNANSVFSKDGWNWWVTGKFDSTVEQLKGGLGEMNAQAAEVAKRLGDAKEKLEQLADASKNKAFVGALNRFGADLDTKLAGMSMSPLEQQLLGIQKQFNATDKQMEKVLDKAREFEKVQKEFETKIKFDETLKQLNFEAAIIGLGDRDKKRADFQRQGFNEDQLDVLMGQWDANEARQKAYAPKLPVPRAEVALAGSREAAATIIANTGRGGMNPAAAAQQAQAKQVEQGNMVVGLLKTLADQGTKAIEQQKVYEKLLREQTLKAGGDDMLFPIDG